MTLGLAHWGRKISWGCSVVRKTLEPKRKEVRGTGLTVLVAKYYSGDRTKKKDMGGIRGTCAGGGRACRVLLGKTEESRPLGKS